MPVLDSEATLHTLHTVARAEVLRVQPPLLLNPPGSTRAQVALIAGFLLGLLVLAYGTFVREQPIFTEDRPRHPVPPMNFKKYEIEDYPRWFDMFLQDRVGFRTELINAHRRIHAAIFGEPASAFAWVGRDGWLFLNVGDPHRGHHDKPSLEDRYAAWVAELAQRKQWCDKRGIEYVVLLAPEKCSVYAEHLTEQQLRSLPQVEPTRVLMELLADCGVPTVSPLPELLAAKQRGLMYHPNDSHWNADGAYLAHQALMKALGFNSTPLVAYAPRQYGHAGDLTRLVGGQGTLAAVQYLMSNATPPDDAPPGEELLDAIAKPKHLRPRRYTNSMAAGPAVLLLHDSFAEAMFPFLSQDCRMLTTAATDGFPVEYILANKPAVVVQELVGRKFYRCQPAR